MFKKHQLLLFSWLLSPILELTRGNVGYVYCSVHKLSHGFTVI